MKHNIRRGVFETNSSSVHTIAIGKSDLEDHQEVWFKVGEFGWEQETYTDVSDKASYLWTAILDSTVRVMSDPAKGEMEAVEDWKNYISETLSTGGIKSVFYMPKDNDFYYVDHSYNLKKWLQSLREDSNLLMHFLFSPDSAIYTGNDNGYMPIVREEDLDENNFLNITEKYN